MGVQAVSWARCLVCVRAEPQGLGDHDNLHRNADDPDIVTDLIRNIICDLSLRGSCPENPQRRLCLYRRQPTWDQRALAPPRSSLGRSLREKTAPPSAPQQDYKRDFVHISHGHFNIHCNNFDHLKFHHHQYYDSGKCETSLAMLCIDDELLKGERLLLLPIHTHANSRRRRL